jgi:5-methyltetrahydrofolate corrinoid/iron sulfur protein methyltransferase
MIVIGELINGARGDVGRAVLERDEQVIQRLAREQAEAGCNYLDVCAGTSSGREVEDLAWLADVVGQAVDLPLCLDSADPDVLAAVAGQMNRELLLNSVSGEPQKLARLIPLAAARGFGLVCLALDERGIPDEAGRRVEILASVVEAARRAGVPDGRLLLDPLTLAAAVRTGTARTTLEVIRALKAEFPDAHVCTAVSNISFGLPARSILNRAFLAMALESGLDGAIMNPLDRELRGALLAAELLLDRDRFCRSYTSAYRRGAIGPRV